MKTLRFEFLILALSFDTLSQALRRAWLFARQRAHSVLTTTSATHHAYVLWSRHLYHSNLLGRLYDLPYRRKSIDACDGRPKRCAVFEVWASSTITDGRPHDYFGDAGHRSYIVKEGLRSGSAVRKLQSKISSQEYRACFEITSDPPRSRTSSSPLIRTFAPCNFSNNASQRRWTGDSRCCCTGQSWTPRKSTRRNLPFLVCF
jgi:hypothetical protein